MPKKAARTKVGRNSSGKRFPLNMRTTIELRQALEEAARHSGRSLAQEVEQRLQRSLQADAGGQVYDTLAHAYGEKTSGLVLLIAAVVASIGSTTTRDVDAADWFSNPYAFDQVAQGVNEVLERARPEGAIAVPTRSRNPQIDNDQSSAHPMRRLRENIGRMIASDTISTMAGRRESEDWMQWGRTLRDLLGPTLVARLQSDRIATP